MLHIVKNNGGFIMSKKMIISAVLFTAITLTANADYRSMKGVSAASVDNNTIMIQNPVYTDDIGRSHFLSRGGYSRVRKVQNGQAYNDAINDVSEKFNKEAKSEKNVSNVIGAPEEDYFSFGSTSSYYEKVKNNYDTSSDYPSGVNASKTIYTDGIGRQHFFGKANLIK